MDIFSIMPIEVFMDDRLSKTDIRVLGAILSWRNKNTNLVWPKREQIAGRCGLPLCKISTATSRLVELGWLVKKGSGGRSMSASYSLSVPDLESIKVTDSVTVTESVTVTDSVTKTLTESVTKTVTDSVRGIKQTNEQTNEQTNTATSARKDSGNCGDYSSAETDSLDGSDFKNHHETSRTKKSGTKKIIASDWQPSERCCELIAAAGIVSGYADGLVGEFVLYWQERGDKRIAWDATFLSHVKRAYERDAHRFRGIGNSVGGGLANNYGAENGGNYAAGRVTGRKLSLVERAQRDCDLAEQLERVQKGGDGLVVN